MFGFSLTKLAVLIVVIVAVWQGFKLVGRLEKARAEGRAPGAEIRARIKDTAEKVAKAVDRPDPKAESEELVWDEKTQSYVPKREGE